MFDLFCLFCFLEATPPAAEDEGEEEVTHIQQEDEEKGGMEDDTQQDKQVCETPLTKKLVLYTWKTLVLTYGKIEKISLLK